ncbi:hypothetical protein AC249_AIPGENE23261 [Exaiptasia diaphana]|nr:hypothetical protein AC249_AIPGENE23261 [Exaiptasia diaphana]
MSQVLHFIIDQCRMSNMCSSTGTSSGGGSGSSGSGSGGGGSGSSGSGSGGSGSGSGGSGSGGGGSVVVVVVGDNGIGSGGGGGGSGSGGSGSGGGDNGSGSGVGGSGSGGGDIGSGSGGGGSGSRDIGSGSGGGGSGSGGSGSGVGGGSSSRDIGSGSGGGDSDKAIRNKITGNEVVFNGVFHVGYKSAGYCWNYFDAKRVCEMFGAGLANLQQLTAAWKIGFDMCSFGWLVDGSMRFPIFYQRSTCGCGCGSPSIRGSPKLKDKMNGKFTGFCYKETDRCNEVDWHQHDKKCYKFFLDSSASWNDATATCAQEGGVLGSMTSKAKLLFVKDFVERQKNSLEQIMVGLRKDSEGIWRWNDGKSVDSSLWKITQPSGPIGTVDVRSTSLNNVPENYKLPFVCQKRIFRNNLLTIRNEDRMGLRFNSPLDQRVKVE